MSLFTRPQGDPGTLRSAASSLTQSAATIAGTRLDSLISAAATAESALPRRRVDDFSAMRQDSATALEESGDVFDGVVGALADFADALETAQTDIDAASEDYQEALRLRRRAQEMGEDGLVTRYQGQMNRAHTRAENALTTYRTAESTARTELAGLASTWVPDGGSLSAVEAWERTAVSLIPSGITDAGSTLRDWYTNGSPSPQSVQEVGQNLASLASSTYHGYGAIRIARNSAAYERIAQALRDSRGQGGGFRSSLKTQRRNAGLRSAHQYYRSLRRYQSERTALRNAQARYPRGGGSFYGRDEIRNNARSNHRSGNPAVRGTPSRQPGAFGRLMNGPVGQAGRFVGRALGPVGAVSGVVDVGRAIFDTSMSTEDRVLTGVGGAGAAAAGGVATYALVAGAALGPVGLGVIAVGGAVAAGVWLYQNREAVKEVGKKVWDGAKSVGKGAVDVGKKVWKGLFG